MRSAEDARCGGEVEMGISKNGVIFSREFPDAHPDALLRQAEALGESAEESAAGRSFEETMAALREKYELRQRPDAGEREREFVICAVTLCESFEIDTTITRRDGEVEVCMALYAGLYFGAAKRAFERLICLCDDVSLSFDGKRPDCVRVSMSCFADAFYLRATGERID